MVFARAPVPGKTKTRLIPALGEAGAAELHTRLIHQTLKTVTEINNTQTTLWCTPDIHHAFFASCADTYKLTRHSQRGDDLGARMHHAFVNALAGAPWAILVGTDCPELSAADFTHAIGELDRGVDAVLGPATDGGYVLIGLKRPHLDLFSDMQWGSDQVAELTRTRMRDLGMRWGELAPHHDIDRPEDLVHLNASPYPSL